MKRLFAIIFSLCLVMQIFADENDFFKSGAYAMSLNSWNATSANYQYQGNKEWAKFALKAFPLENGEVRHSYVINAQDTIDIPRTMNLILQWMGSAFANDNLAVLTNDKENHRIEAVVTYEGLGKHKKYYSKSQVDAPTRISVAFKENRFKIDFVTSEWILATEGDYQDDKTKRLPIADNFPVNEKSKNQDVMAEAFLNLNARALNKVWNLLKYLNSKYAETPDSQSTDSKQEKAKTENDW